MTILDEYVKNKIIESYSIKERIEKEEGQIIFDMIVWLELSEKWLKPIGSYTYKDIIVKGLGKENCIKKAKEYIDKLILEHKS